jgi:tetratricopeptide (TPR) repeat protein
MAGQASNPKIEELRARVKADTKSRLFYPLAEELRKAGRAEEAVQVLREGLAVHPTYISAGISLGRALNETGNFVESVEALKKALAADPGNVVAARSLAEAYLGLGDKVEAIKKFKLAHALMPSDEEIESEIDRLDRELNADKYAAAAVAAPEPFGEATPVSEPMEASSIPESQDRELHPDTATVFPTETESLPAVEESPVFEDQAQAAAQPEVTAAAEEPQSTPGDKFDQTEPVFEGSGQSAAVGEAIPEAASPRLPTLDRPFDMPAESEISSAPTDSVWAEEPAPSISTASETESPFDQTAPVVGEVEEARVDSEAPLRTEADFDMATAPSAVAVEPTATVTMGELYAQQGYRDAAREIYDKVLAREPDNAQAAEHLRALDAEAGPGEGCEVKIARLNAWLDKVGKRGAAGL